MSNTTGKGYELRGRVLHVGGTETPGSGKFQKRVIVLEIGDKYPQKVPIWFVQAATAKLDAAFVGYDATVTFDVNGREWNGKYFAELRGWAIKIDREDGKAPEKPAAAEPAQQAAKQADQETDGALPF
jgi:single-strand DNA-binding protein